MLAVSGIAAPEDRTRWLGRDDVEKMSRKFLISIFKRPIQLQDRHCEPTGRANARPMTGSAKQSIARQK
jgi:hypothetical protein